MSFKMQRLMKAVVASIAAVVLALGAHTLIAAPSSVCNPNQPGYVGECPPLDPTTCNNTCWELYRSMGNECGGDCCICAVR